MSIFDKEETFAFVAKRMAEIKATEEAWFAEPPAEEKPQFVHTSPGKLTGVTPDLEQEWWDEYYSRDIE